MVVLDTAVLLYWTLDPKELTPAASQAIAEADKNVTSSISVWGIALKVRQGKLVIPLPMADYVDRLNMMTDLVVLWATG